jgi:hypothetical protein
MRRVFLLAAAAQVDAHGQIGSTPIRNESRRPRWRWWTQGYEAMIGDVSRPVEETGAAIPIDGGWTAK